MKNKTWDASSLTSYIIQGLRITCHLLDYNNRSNPREDIYVLKQPVLTLKTNYT